MRSLSRLLKPKSIAVIGGRWAENVITQLQKSGYAGDIWPIHPKRQQFCGIPCFENVTSLPAAPDAAFIGVNRALTVNIMQDLSDLGAGGAICFASGFQEAGRSDLQDELVMAAGEMPFLGPNCYGLLNYLDNTMLWPDQHGGLPTSTGVGILAQSSNIAINMTMQKRGLPIGQIITLGNQAQTGLADLIEAQINDPRITAIGLYLEGFGDIRAFERAALKAHACGKPIIALKTGASEKSQMTALSHTASLAGSAVTSSALLRRLGIAEVKSLDVFLETLKILHLSGPLSGNRLSSVSCSGGEASLMSDLSEPLHLQFPDFPEAALGQISKVLGPDVTLANPLDYHTYIWGDVQAMTACFEGVMNAGLDMNVFVLDIPRPDRCDTTSFEPTVQAIIQAQKNTDAPVAILSSLPENLDEEFVDQFHNCGIVVLNGMETGLKALETAYISSRFLTAPAPEKPVWLATQNGGSEVLLSEFAAKSALKEFGLETPRSATCASVEDIELLAENLTFPLALKTLGLAHKTEAGGVILGIDSPGALALACQNIPTAGTGYLIEEMVTNSVAELIIGITRDPTGLMTLTLGAGGILTELLQDSVSLILPSCRADIEKALSSLKVYSLLTGYRGQTAANITALLSAVEAVTAYADAEKTNLLELDVNPLMACADKAIAVDALIRMTQN